MQATNFNHYLQKLKMTKIHTDPEYLGIDTEITPEILELFVLELDVKTSQQACIPASGSVKLDEYELAMAS